MKTKQRIRVATVPGVPEPIITDEWTARREIVRTDPYAVTVAQDDTQRAEELPMPVTSLTRQVLGCFSSYHPQGLTDERLHLLTALDQNNVSVARRALCRAGWLGDTHDRGWRPSDVVWGLTRAGRIRLEKP